MINKKIYIIIFSIIICSQFLLNDNEIKNCLSISYLGKNSYVEIHYDLHNTNGRKYHLKYKVLENEKIIEDKSIEIDFKEIESLINWICENSVFKLKSASLFDDSTSNAYFKEMYDKKLPRIDAIRYAFIIKYNKKVNEFSIDDIGNISDPKYLSLLNNLNKIANLPLFKTTFDFINFLNK